MQPISVCALLLLATTGFSNEIYFISCGEDHLGVSSVDITPYPPHAGDTLRIVVQGKNDIDLMAGSRVLLANVEWPIPADPISYDLCASLSGNVHCPVKSGTRSIATFNYTVPWGALPGTVQSFLITLDPQGKEISCIWADIEIADGMVTSFLRSGTLNSDTVTGEDDS